MKLFRGLLIVFVLGVVAAMPWLVKDTIPQEASRAIVEKGNGAGVSMMSKVAGMMGNLFSVAEVREISPSGKKSNARVAAAAGRAVPLMAAELEKKSLKVGDPIYIRVFKEESELEMWMQSGGSGEFALFKTYKICKWSGRLGPKQKEGDGQAPEGFYFVPAGKMNPNSRYHLSFDIGYPNTFDKFHGRTGSFIMIHGSCVSIGCFAMTDEGIEEIYTLADAAHLGGQRFFRVHSFPFRMTDDRMAKEESKKAKWIDFWANLKEGYDYFEMMKLPPNVTTEEGRYLFGS